MAKPDTKRSMTDDQMADIYAKKRTKNIRLLIGLFIFVFSLIVLSFIVRLNHIKGMIE